MELAGTTQLGPGSNTTQGRYIGWYSQLTAGLINVVELVDVVVVEVVELKLVVGVVEVLTVVVVGLVVVAVVVRGAKLGCGVISALTREGFPFATNCVGILKKLLLCCLSCFTMLARSGRARRPASPAWSCVWGRAASWTV